MADDDQKTSSPTVLYQAGQQDTDVADPKTGAGDVDAAGRQRVVGQEPAEASASQAPAPNVDAAGREWIVSEGETEPRPPGVISLDDTDLKLLDLDALEAMPDLEFFQKSDGWLKALRQSFRYDTTLFPENELLEVPLIGQEKPVNLKTIDRHFAQDNDANDVAANKLYLEEALLILPGVLSVMAKKVKHRPDLDPFRGENEHFDAKEYFEDISSKLIEGKWIDPKTLDTNEATLKVHKKIDDGLEVIEKVAPRLEAEATEAEKSDESDVEVERNKPEPEVATSTTPTGEGSADAEGDNEGGEAMPEETEGDLPDFDALIDPQLPEIVAYLEATVRAEGLEPPDSETLATFAKDHLRGLDTATIMGIAAGIPLYRQKQLERLQKALFKTFTYELPSADELVRDMALGNLKGIIADRLADGANPDEILAELDSLSNEELTALLGVPITDLNVTEMRGRIKQRATQLLIAVFSAPPTGKKISTTDRPKTVATYSVVAQNAQEKNKELDENINSAAAGNKHAGQKVQAFLKAYQKTWVGLTLDEQIMVYFLADLPLSDNMFSSTVNLDQKLPLPFDYVGMAYDMYKPEFRNLLADFQKDRAHYKAINKNRQLKAQLLATLSQKRSAMNEVEYLKAFVQQESQLQLDAYQNLTSRDKEKLALAAGFASAAELEFRLTEKVKEAPTYYSDNFVRAVESVPVDQPDVIEITFQIQPNPMFDEEFAAALVAAESEMELAQAYQQFAVEDQGYTTASPDHLPLPKGARRSNVMVDAAKNRVRNSFKQARQKMVKKGTKKVAEQLAKQGVRAAGKATAGLTAGLSLVASEVLANKQLRDGALVGLTAMTAYIVDSFGTVGGLLGAGVGAVGGFFAGGVPGAIVGAGAGAMGGRMFFDSMGWNPRWMSARQYPIGQAPMEPGMQAMRQYGPQPAPPGWSGPGAEGAAAGAGEGGGAGSLGFGQSGSAGAMPQFAGQSAAATGVVGTATTFLTGAMMAAAGPALAFAGFFFMTMMVLTVIWGAFLVWTPDEAGQLPYLPGKPGDPGTPQESQYITIRKFATPNKIPNSTATSITYTIQVEAKSGYAVQVRRLDDRFSSMGEQKPEGLVSPVAPNAFGDDLITTTKEVSYQMTYQGVDALVMNTAEITFDVYNEGGVVGTPEASEQKARTSATVIIGNPRLGCWPVSGGITQLESARSSNSHRRYNSDALDIAPRGGSGLTIYSPFVGRACAADTNGLDYGKHVKVSTVFNDVNVVLIFAHFSRFEGGLAPGKCIDVTPGQAIGIMGTTGNSTGVHLHYELQRGHGSALRLRDLITGSQDVVVGSRVETCF